MTLYVLDTDTLEHGGTLVTRNVRDFQVIPDLPIVDWSA